MFGLKFLQTGSKIRNRDWGQMPFWMKQELFNVSSLEGPGVETHKIKPRGVLDGHSGTRSSSSESSLTS